MNPIEVGKSYDSIAQQWQNPTNALPGIPPHEKAIQFVTTYGHALDVGCGCNGRFISLLQKHGFQVEGIDVSEQMLALAKQRNPEVVFYHDDISCWTLPRKYGFITGWDSIWHVPLAFQADVLRKLCIGLNDGGVLIFTMGGTDRPGEIRDSYMGPPMYTATLGIPETLTVLAENDCICKHLEFDQYPQLHVYIVAQKASLVLE